MAKAERDAINLNAGELVAETLARIEELDAVIAAGKRARSALWARRRDHRKFGVGTKNRSRVSAMMDMAAPHLRLPPEAFNPEPLAVATKTHTLRFVKRVVDDADHPRAREDGTVDRWVIEATEGHRRENWITALAPVAYRQHGALSA